MDANTVDHEQILCSGVRLSRGCKAGLHGLILTCHWRQVLLLLHPVVFSIL